MSFTEPKPLPADPTALATIEEQVTAEMELERQLALGATARGAAARARREPRAVASVAEPALPEAPKPKTGQEISFDELGDYVGRRVRINTTQMLNRVATVEKFSKEAVTLRVHFTGGSATYEFSRDNLRRIVVM
jgi:hypothetical protein